MSARIIQFVPRRERDAGNSPSAFRIVPRPDDLAMDHADRVLCEYVPPHARWHNDVEPA